MLDLVLSDWFRLISLTDNGCKAGSTITSLLTSSSISAMLPISSLSLRVTNLPSWMTLRNVRYMVWSSPNN